MKIQRISAIFLRQFYLLRRSPYRILNLLHWAFLDLIVWGLTLFYIYTAGNVKLNFLFVILGAVILWNFLIRVQQGITISFLEDIWVRNFMNLFASPLTLNEYILGLVSISIFQAFIQSTLMIFLAWILFAYNIFQFGFLLIPFIVVLFIFGLALGLFSTAFILRLGPSSELLAWFIPAWISPLAGVFYSVSALPYWVQFLAYALPPMYIFEGMRKIVLSGSFDLNDLFIAFTISVVSFILAYWFLLRSYRYVLRRGLFTRFMTD